MFPVALVAQWIEQEPSNLLVAGSIPAEGAKKTNWYSPKMRSLMGLTRYAVLVPAIASLLGALLLMGQGSVEMVRSVLASLTNQESLKETIVSVLTAVDGILLGTVLLVIGYGLYELFIDTDIKVPAWLQVRDLDDLKSKLIGVVVAIIAVVFVGVFVDANRATEVISYGVGAGALVAGLALFAYATRKESAKEKAEPKIPKTKP